MYEKLKKNDVTHWWYRGRRSIIDSLIKSKLPKKRYNIIDIGCGFGGNVTMLKKYGSVSVMDIDKELMKDIDVPNKIVAKIPEQIREKFDLILLSDVLEHTEDDKGVALWIKNSLRRGGSL